MRQNDQVAIRLRSAIADLKCSAVSDAEYEPSPLAPSPAKIAGVTTLSPEHEAAETELPETVFAAPIALASADVQPAEKADTVDLASVVAAQHLLAELRTAGEALVREVSVLETRLDQEGQLVEATRDYMTTAKRAEGAAIVEQQAEELAQAASSQAASARSDAETAKAQIAQLERCLQDAQSRAKECAAAEDAARCEAAEAAARVAASQAASVAALKEAQAAQERAKALRDALPQGKPSFAGISDVQAIAARIVEEAAALARDTRETPSDPLLDTAVWQW